jgi:hypothetical protein
LAENRTLWVRGGGMTVAVDLKRAQAFKLPDTEDDGAPWEGMPERVRWNRLSSFNGEARVFVGGAASMRGSRPVFAAQPDSPLIVFFYEGKDDDLLSRVVRGSRQANPFWNFLTPYALILGVFSEAAVAALFIMRPAYRELVFTAFVALLSPILPYFPPGLAFTVFYRRFWRRSLERRARHDLAVFTDGIPPKGGLGGARACEALSFLFLLLSFAANLIFIRIMLLFAP